MTTSPCSRPPSSPSYTSLSLLDIDSFFSSGVKDSEVVQLPCSSKDFDIQKAAALRIHYFRATGEPCRMSYAPDLHKSGLSLFTLHQSLI